MIIIRTDQSGSLEHTIRAGDWRHSRDSKERTYVKTDSRGRRVEDAEDAHPKRDLFLCVCVFFPTNFQGLDECVRVG